MGCDTDIHVLHVLSTLGLGGMELAMARVIDGLSGNGMRHSIVCLKADLRVPAQLVSRVPIYCLGGGTKTLLPMRLAGLVRRIRPTLCHARNWGSWPDAAMAGCLLGRSVPLVFSFHGLNQPLPIPLRRRLAFRLLSHVTAEVFTVSEASRLMLVEHVGLDGRRVGVIRNGVDSARFRPRPTGQGGGRLIVGTVGNLTPVKNQAMLIEACAELVCSGVDLELRIAGEGPRRSELEDLGRALGMGTRLSMPGHVEDVPGFLRGLDVFVLSSLSEQSPNALLEAMSCGLPCVATRVGGVKEMLGSGECGIVVECGDGHGMTAGIGQLARSAELRAKFGYLARDRVEREYTMRQMLEAYGEIYRRLSVQGLWPSAVAMAPARQGG